jgi:hypothetical protein
MWERSPFINGVAYKKHDLRLGRKTSSSSRLSQSHHIAPVLVYISHICTSTISDTSRLFHYDTIDTAALVAVVIASEFIAQIKHDEALGILKNKIGRTIDSRRKRVCITLVVLIFAGFDQGWRIFYLIN